MRNRDHIVVQQGQMVAQSQPAPNREQPCAYAEPEFSVPTAVGYSGSIDGC